MLTRTSSIVPVEGTQSLSGRDLKRLVRAADSTEKALLAADIEAGRVVVERLTPRQARTLTGAPVVYAYAARRLSPMERAAVRVGCLKLADKARERRPISDSRIERFIQAAGAGRVLNVIDKLTAPTAVAAE